MEVHELKNYGCVFTAKPPAMLEMKIGASMMSELGVTNVPKFLAKMPINSRRWKRKKFQALQERTVKNQDFIDGIYDNLATYDTIVGLVGKEKAMEIFSNVGPKATEMLLEEHLPPAEDFLKCNDPWNALREYLFDFFRLNNREGVMHHEIITDSDDELYVVLHDCAFSAVSHEAGYPEVFGIASRGDDVVFTRLAQSLGWEWFRSKTLCRGDDICEYGFRRLTKT